MQRGFKEPGEKPRRFYKAVDVQAEAGGFLLFLHLLAEIVQMRSLACLDGVCVIRHDGKCSCPKACGEWGHSIADHP